MKSKTNTNIISGRRKGGQKSRHAIHRGRRRTLAGLTLIAWGCILGPAMSQEARVGTLQGQTGVSPSGAATYTLPVEIPKGRNGMQPSLAFVYNNQQPGNIMGPGWSLAGFSSISRTNPTPYYSGTHDNIDFLDDEFLLDGKHLIKTAEEAGKTYFRTEVDEITRIIFHHGPGEKSWFEVKTKNGITREYGRSNTSRQVYQQENEDFPLVWHLNRMVDHHDNTIEWVYVRDLQNGELHPDRIEYTGDRSTREKGFYTIELNYAGLDPAMQQTACFEKNGKKYLNKNTLRLQSLVIRETEKVDSRIREYLLDYYENTGAVEEHFLKSVTLKEKGEFLNPTLFGWSFYFPEYNCMAVEAEDDTLFGMSPTGELSMTRVDWDGDLQDEIAACKITIEGKSSIKTVLSFFSGNTEASITLAEKPILFGPLQAADINLSSDDELIIDLEQGFKIFDIVRSGSTFELPEIYSYDGMGDPHIGDFNRDGIADCLITRSTDARLLLGTGSGDQGSFMGDEPDEPDPPKLIFPPGFRFESTGEFNGDGATDVVLINEDTKFLRFYLYDIQNASFFSYCQVQYVKSERQHYADFNGDGKKDIFLTWKDPAGSSTRGKVYFSFGDGFYTSDEMNRTFEGVNPMVADINNDERADVFGLVNLYTLLISYTKPDGITGNLEQDTVNPACFDTGQELKIAGMTLADLDGNGIHDLVLGIAETEEPPDDVPAYPLQMVTLTDTGFGTNAITAITNGLGATDSIAYQPLSSMVSEEPPAYPLARFRSPVYLVKETFTAGDNGQRLYHQAFAFSDPVMHLSGKGFIGFKKASSRDYFNGTMTESRFSIFIAEIDNTSYYFHPYLHDQKRYVLEALGQGPVLSAEKYKLGYKNTVPGKALVYLPVVTEIESKSWDANGSFVGTSKYIQQPADMDQYGNVLKTTLLNDEGEPAGDNGFNYSTIVTSNFALHYDTANWLLARPDYIHVTRKSGEGKKDFQTRYFNYCSREKEGWPLVKKVSILPNGSKRLQTEIHYTYNRFGHVVSKILKAPNFELDGKQWPVRDRIIRYAYSDADGYGSRFLTGKWSEMDGSVFMTSFSYDPLTATVLSEQTPDHLTTTYDYDAFDHLGEIHHPDGTVTYKTLGWAGETAYASDLPEASFYTSNHTRAAIDGSEQDKQLAIHDRYGRVLRRVWFNIDESPVYTDRQYDSAGRLCRVSEPYPASGEAELWTSYHYDGLGRVKLKELPNGNRITKEYRGRKTLTTDHGRSLSTMREKNAIGQNILYEDPAGTVRYSYFSSGNIKQIDALGSVTAFNYDEAGNRQSILEPNSGLTASDYNPFGELVRQTDQQGNTYEMEYDGLGRITTKKLANSGEVVAAYTYQDVKPPGDQTGMGYGKVKDITGHNGISYHYHYDAMSRLVEYIEVIRNEMESLEFTTTHQYDENMGRLSRTSYPSGFELGFEYAQNGMLKKVKDLRHNLDIWYDPVVNARGQVTSYRLGNGLETHKGFDLYGLPTEISTPPHQELHFGFDPVTENLTWRADSIFNLVEHFGYDDILSSRLESWRVNDGQEYQVNYRENGNILRKTDVTDPSGPSGTYVYDFLDQPHAVKKIIKPTGQYLGSLPEIQEISFTPFNKIASIQSDKGDTAYRLNFVYGPREERKITRLLSATRSELELVKTRLFLSANYEVETDRNGDERKLHYIYGGDGLCAIYEISSSGEEMHYIHRDHLGSYQAITDGQGRLTERLSFDPWGRRRNPEKWTFENVPQEYLFDRGYTGHEHLDHFNLINMNGRVYDPWLGRFLSPDMIVQDPGSSQSHNRYSYAFNNPLRYIDPSGYWNGDFPRDIWLKYEGFGMSQLWYQLMGNSMINQLNEGRFHPAFGGMNSLNSHMASAGYVYLGSDQYADLAGNTVLYDDVFNNHIVPNSMNFFGVNAKTFYAAIQEYYNHSAEPNRVADYLAANAGSPHETPGLDYFGDDPPAKSGDGGKIREGKLSLMSFDERKDYFAKQGYSYASDREAQDLLLGSSGKILSTEALLISLLSLKVKSSILGWLGLIYAASDLAQNHVEMNNYHHYNYYGENQGIFYKNNFVITGDQMLYYREIRYANSGKILGTVFP